MEYPWIPAAVLAYVWMGIMMTFAMLCGWYFRQHVPFLFFLMLFPINTFRGRSEKNPPPVDWVSERWGDRERPFLSRRGYMIGYCILSLTLWPLRLPWIILCFIAFCVFVVVLLTYGFFATLYRLARHDGPDVFCRVVVHLPLV